jgi:hypothetical protein
MMVFSSFDPSFIDLNRTSARAVADLKHFIEFAQRGPEALSQAVRGSVGGYDSPFEEAVANGLRRKGWHVVRKLAYPVSVLIWGSFIRISLATILSVLNVTVPLTIAQQQHAIAIKSAALSYRAWAGNYCASGQLNGGLIKKVHSTGWIQQ